MIWIIRPSCLSEIIYDLWSLKTHRFNFLYNSQGTQTKLTIRTFSVQRSHTNPCPNLQLLFAYRKRWGCWGFGESENVYDNGAPLPYCSCYLHFPTSVPDCSTASANESLLLHLPPTSIVKKWYKRYTIVQATASPAFTSRIYLRSDALPKPPSSLSQLMARDY